MMNWNEETGQFQQTSTKENVHNTWVCGNLEIYTGKYIVADGIKYSVGFYIS